jgi:hypothetical protein
LKKKAKIASAVLAMLLLVAGTTWYCYAHPEWGSTRAASFLAAYNPMGAESPRIHQERVQLHGDCIPAAPNACSTALALNNPVQGDR